MAIWRICCFLHCSRRMLEVSQQYTSRYKSGLRVPIRCLTYSSANAEVPVAQD